MNTKGQSRSIPAVVDYVRLPAKIRPGIFDVNGLPLGAASDRARIYIAVENTAFIWGRFETQLAPGQRGELTFTDIPGTFLVGTTFTEWNERNAEPVVSDALLTLIASQRGDGTIRVIGRNTSSRPVWAVAGIVIGDRAPYPQNP